MRSPLKRYYGNGDLHFVTFSCRRRRAFLGTVRARNRFVKIIDQLRSKHHFLLLGFVVMPEHVHLILNEPPGSNPVQLRCVIVSGEKESCFDQVDGNQLRHYFREKKDGPAELIVTIAYCDIHGNECPPRSFRILKQDDKRILMPDRIVCEPMKA